MRTNVLSIPMLNFNGNSIFEHFDRDLGDIGFLHVFNSSSKGTARSKKIGTGAARGSKDPTALACKQVLNSKSLVRKEFQTTKSLTAIKSLK